VPPASSKLSYHGSLLLVIPLREGWQQRPIPALSKRAAVLVSIVVVVVVVVVIIVEGVVVIVLAAWLPHDTYLSCRFPSHPIH